MSNKLGSIPRVLLSSGYRMPQLGLGTWDGNRGETQGPSSGIGTVVEEAIKRGYRLIDTAVAYRNQPDVGDAIQRCIANGVVKREDLFVTSKVWNTCHSFDRCTQSIELTLQQLKLDYLDLFLIHWPPGYDETGPVDCKTVEELVPLDSSGVVKTSGVDHLETWEAMSKAVKEEKIRSIGLSNFNSVQTARIMEWSKMHSPDTPVSVLQVELHPYFPQTPLLEFCKASGIAMNAFASLGSAHSPYRKDEHPILMEEEAVQKAAQQHGKTPAQILLRWAIQRGIVVIPKSSKPERLTQNIDIFDFELDQSQMNGIDGLDRGLRTFQCVRDTKLQDFPFKAVF